ncbi:acetate/propionate family kinase [Roseateles sp. SL47]|uniref:acetate/propionate family kinase n=1 Tax=Roseateles sp. SL47 TaxID=2995138 RepID=UPI0022720A26|nr:acetate/propionate family kinase [Roseateles sp. SL47]WAC74020.1 acetate/propionate family kinase [Roseateles sp. SL47]
MSKRKKEDMDPRLEGEFIAVVNAGSSSVKLSMFSLHAGGAPAGTPPLRLELHAQVEGLGGPGTTPHFEARHADRSPAGTRDWPREPITHERAIDHLAAFIQHEYPQIEMLGIGHRVVHGGTGFHQPVVVTPALLEQLEALVPLAPLHQPHNLAPIRRALEGLPGLPQVACFDTAFHQSQSVVAQTYALPYELYDAGVRRYGFHGLSYEYIASRLPHVSPALADGRVVALHLGNGVSACALRAGRSVASSMGFTAVEGLPMGTRSGSVDPGVLLYLMDERGMGTRALERLLYQQSGLLGLSGVSSDMRTLLASEAPKAQLAIDVFVHRIAREIGALAADLGGLDGLVFTAGIGEHAPLIRQRVMERCAWLGLVPDDAANRLASSGPQGERRISASSSRCEAWVIPTDEELMMARHTYRALAGRD